MFSKTVKTCIVYKTSSGKKCGHFCQKGRVVCPKHMNRGMFKNAVNSVEHLKTKHTVKRAKTLFDDIDDIDDIENERFEAEIKNYLITIDGIFNSN